MGNWILDQLFGSVGAAWTGLLAAAGLVLPGFSEIAALPPAAWLVLGLAGAFLFLWGWFRNPLIAALVVLSIGIWFAVRGRGAAAAQPAGQPAPTPARRPGLLQRILERRKP
ncbi:MAG: hypothetical protein H6873_05695 [Hyphomicrobiaceae bacterium]|nr:hypothetical protein [Hyphomicrobiaceae bacterium]